MRRKRMNRLLEGLVFLFLVLGLCSTGFAQGRGHGGGRGSGGGIGGSAMGNPNGGRPDSVGVDRGLERSSNASKGRADNGRSTAADRSNGRSDEGLSRASDNLRRADKELSEHPGISSALHVNANDLRAQYKAALVTNPGLKFGQFVAATRVAQNLGRRNPNITRSAILAGLASGRSLGQTLQDLGLSERQANEARKQAEREIKRARDQ
ncbi:MAG: hypothetical protein C5B44_04575 [Acidobacteria bacterium]|nr:MAG: hypothetical protein C5B44_04575 [Acidobacteriota bacterium]